MKLLYAPNSPFSRKCRVVIREKGLDVEEIVTMPPENPAQLLAANPLGRVPAFITHDGSTFCESAVICEYLDQLPSEAPALFPAKNNARFSVLSLAALGDGIAEAAVQCFMETRRPAEKRSQEWIDRKQQSILRTVDALAHMHLDPKAPLTIGTIAVACALDYVRFRLIHLGWQDTQPQLAKWFEETLQHPSFAATAPMP